MEIICQLKMVKNKDYLGNHLNNQHILKTSNLKFQLRLIPARHQIVDYFDKKFQTLKWSFLWSISHMYTWPKLKIGIASLKMTYYKACFTNFKLLFLVCNCLQKTDLKPVSAIFCQIFIFWPNDSSLKTMEYGFYFI